MSKIIQLNFSTYLDQLRLWVYVCMCIVSNIDLIHVVMTVNKARREVTRPTIGERPATPLSLDWLIAHTHTNFRASGNQSKTRFRYFFGPIE